MTAIVIGPALVIALLAQSPPSAAQPPVRSVAHMATPPAGPALPDGQQITARDGDTVIVSGHARIRLIRRVDAKVRALYIAADQRIILLLDEADAGGAPHGAVNSQLVFDGVTGNWPLGDRWEGKATLDEYVPVDRTSSIAGYGFRTTAGLLQLFPSGSTLGSDLFHDHTAVAVVSYRGAARGILANDLDFDAAERAVVAAESHRDALTSAGGATSQSGNGVTGGAPAPVRVGGGIQPPTKIVDVKPVYPPEAMASRPQGTVIIEATIGTDGTVQNAKVLRSIPLLDDAALAAVRQWRFTPTLVNGQPVPVVMTVAVNFRLRN